MRKPREGCYVPRTRLRNATIVFDLDGALVDTAPDLTNALNDALTRRGHTAIPQETIRSAVGFGARVMIEEALRRAGAAEDIDEMLAEFLVHYEANIAAESRPFLGAVASLETLAASGARLAICTNKCEYLTRKLLEALGLQHYFKRHRRPRHLRRIEARPGAPHPGDRAGRRRPVPSHRGGRQRRRHRHGKRCPGALDPGELRLCAGSAGRAYS
jgi:phosphoglycolate phosphatase-like HAD superfamily hydrolase